MKHAEVLCRLNGAALIYSGYTVVIVYFGSTTRMQNNNAE